MSLTQSVARVAFCAVIAFASVGACAVRPPRPTADDLLRRLGRGEGAMLVGLLNDDRSAFAAAVYEDIESGDPKWLDVACRLHEFSDASVTLSLQFSVARALPRKPLHVLSLIGTCFEVDDVCTDPYIEDARESASHVLRVERALSQPLDRSVEAVARRCLARVRRDTGPSNGRNPSHPR